MTEPESEVNLKITCMESEATPRKRDVWASCTSAGDSPWMTNCGEGGRRHHGMRLGFTV